MEPFSYNTLSANPNFTFIDKIEIRGHMGYLRFHDDTDGLTHSKQVGRHRGLLQEEEQERQRVPTPNDDFFWDEGEQASLEAQKEVVRESLLSTPHDPCLGEANFTQPCGWIFGKFSDFNYNRNHYVAKTSIKGLFPKPLFGGRLLIKEVGGGNLNRLQSVYGREAAQGYRHYRSVGYALSLNLARYVRYNGWDTGIGGIGGAIGIRNDVDGNVVGYSVAEDDGEWALDGGDNWFSEHKHELLSIAPSDFVMDGFRSYLMQVERGIDQELCRAEPSIIGSDDTNRDAFFIREGEVPRKYRLDYCEFAWEFSTDDPNRIVDELSPIARMYGARAVEENEYRVTGESEMFARGVVIRLSGGNQLAFYAKTNRRVRFEYRYRSNRSKEYTATPLSRKTFDSMHSLTCGIAELRGHATEEMESFFTLVRDIKGGEGNDVPQKTLSDLYLRILVATENDMELATIIIDRLASSQSLPRAGGVSNAAMNRAIRHLKEDRPDKAVSYDRATATYRSTPAYREAIARAGELRGG